MTSFEGCCSSYPHFLDWREEARSFQGMEITHGIQARLGDENPERYDATELSAGMFRLVGQQPVLGRDFSRANEVDGSPPVAILQYDFWRQRFNGDPGIIGSKVTINRSPTTIIGVMPEGFLFPQKNEMWVPLVKTANAMKRDNRQTWMVIGRLKDGVTIGAARAEVRAIAERLARMYPETNKGVPIFVETYTEFLWARIRPCCTPRCGAWSASSC
jgi:putative ABC transport system permease protein